MVETLVSLLIWVLVVGIVLYIVRLIIDALPIEQPFKTIAWLIILVIVLLILLLKVLPLLGLHAATSLALGELVRSAAT